MARRRVPAVRAVAAAERARGDGDEGWEGVVWDVVDRGPVGNDEGGGRG